MTIKLELCWHASERGLYWAATVEGSDELRYTAPTAEEALFKLKAAIRAGLKEPIEVKNEVKNNVS